MSSKYNYKDQLFKLLSLRAFLFLAILLTSMLLTSCNSEDIEPSSSLAGVEMTPGEEFPMPIEGCVGPKNITDHGLNQSVSETDECTTCVGASAPNFKLLDVNPTSCGIGQYYGLEAFEGKVTFVVLLRSTCGYCMAQLEKLEQMRYEFLAMGLELHMVVINERGTQAQVNNLTERAQIPIWQDVEEVMAWESLSSPDPDNDVARVGGDKDDMYIYDRQGNLWRFLDDDDLEHKLNLSDEEGYNYLKEALVDAINNAP